MRCRLLENSTQFTLLSLLAMALIFFLLWPHPTGADESSASQAPAPALSIEPSSAYENQTVRVQASLPPACPGASGLTLTLDGQPLAFHLSNGQLDASLTAPLGAHRVQLSGASCSAAAGFRVIEAPCVSGRSKACAGAGGCTGQSVCNAGAWSACRLPERVCDPGQRIPCTSDSCHWGFSACNSCGTAWGPCTPP